MQFDKIYTGQKQNYISKVNTQESNPLDSSFPWIKLMGFNNKESFTQKASQVYKYINSIPSYDELKDNKELQKKFISSLESDLIEKKTKSLEQVVVDIPRSTGAPPIFGKLLIYCFVVNFDKKTTYTQGDNFQLLGLLKSVQTIFKKKEKSVLVTAYLYNEIYKKIIKNFTFPQDFDTQAPAFLRWCILTFSLSKNKKMLKNINNQKIIELFEHFLNPNSVLLKDAETNFPIIGSTSSFNTNQIIRIYGHMLMFEDIISLITYFITIFIQSNTLSKLFNKLPDISTTHVAEEVIKWVTLHKEHEDQANLGIMGSVYSENFDYDIYLKIYQYLTKPAENIRFSGDKENRVPYIYTLYKQFTAELSNFESQGVKIYEKISIFNEKDEDEEEDETFGRQQTFLGPGKQHDDDEDTREHKSRDSSPRYDEEKEVEELERRMLNLGGGAKKQKPLHAMNIRELCDLASKFKNVKNPYVEKKKKKKKKKKKEKYKTFRKRGHKKNKTMKSR